MNQDYCSQMTERTDGNREFFGARGRSGQECEELQLQAGGQLMSSGRCYLPLCHPLLPFLGLGGLSLPQVPRLLRIYIFFIRSNPCGEWLLYCKSFNRSTESLCLGGELAISHPFSVLLVRLPISSPLIPWAKFRGVDTALAFNPRPRPPKHTELVLCF